MLRRTPENRGGGLLGCPNEFCSDFARGRSESERIWTPLMPMSVGFVRTFWVPEGPKKISPQGEAARWCVHVRVWNPSLQNVEK